jgi:hypothetical protein
MHRDQACRFEHSSERASQEKAGSEYINGEIAVKRRSKKGW